MRIGTRTVWQGLVMAGLTVLTAALAVEAGARWIVPMSDEFFRVDSVMGIHHIEGRSGRWVSAEFDVRIRINRDGFRDADRAWEKPPGTRRIVVLGDSMTEAFQVSVEDTFVAGLERRLRASDRTVEVLNLGVSATGPPQAYLVYRARGRRYGADVVVLALFTGNDFRSALPELEGKPYLRYPVIDATGDLARDAAGDVRFTTPAAPGALRQWARTHLASYRFVRDRVLPVVGAGAVTAASDDMLALYGEPLAPAWRRAVDVTLAMVGELERVVRADGARLVVLVIPAPWEVDPARALAGGRGGDVDWRRAERRAEAGLRGRGIEVVSVTGSFASEIARGGRPYFAADGHLTPRGHALVAERLAGSLGSAL